MDKVLELADKAGMCYVDAHRTITCTESALHRFYTLARADLEAECERRKTQFASAEFAVSELKAEIEKLREALQPFVLANSSEEHMTLIVRTADITAARTALGETKC